MSEQKSEGERGREPARGGGRGRDNEWNKKRKKEGGRKRERKR